MKLPEPAEYVWEPDGTFDIGQQRQLSTNTGPCGGWNVYPIYTAAQMREFRNATLEEAAKVCEAQVQMINVNGQNGRYKECAAAIRALKEVQS